MSTDKFDIGVLAHHPRLKRVSRLSAGDLSITLGGKAYTHVCLLVTDEEWRAIVRDVDQIVTKLDVNIEEKIKEATP